MRLLVEKLLVAATSSALRSRLNRRCFSQAPKRWWLVLFLCDVLDIIFVVVVVIAATTTTTTVFVA